MPKIGRICGTWTGKSPQNDSVHVAEQYGNQTYFNGGHGDFQHKDRFVLCGQRRGNWCPRLPPATVYIVQNAFIVKNPSVAAKSAVGSGDCMLAGLTYGFLHGFSFGEAVIHGVAAGTANTLTIGAGQFKIEDFEQLRNQVHILKDVAVAYWFVTSPCISMFLAPIINPHLYLVVQHIRFIRLKTPRTRHQSESPRPSQKRMQGRAATSSHRAGLRESRSGSSECETKSIDHVPSVRQCLCP